MIREINKVQLLGNLVMTPDFRDATSTSDERTYFRMAVNNSNRKVDKPWFIDVICWSRLAKAVATWCDKGKEVYVEGSLETRLVSVDGKQLVTFHVKASEVKFGDSSKKQKDLSPSERPRTSHYQEPESGEFSYDMPDFSDPYADEQPSAPPQENSSGLNEVLKNLNQQDLLNAIVNLTKETVKKRSKF